MTPDYDLNLMQPGQTLSALTANIVAGLDSVLLRVRPDVVVVQGDTTTTLGGALAAFYPASQWRTWRGCGRAT